jgi:hypothetical protein
MLFELRQSFFNCSPLVGQSSMPNHLPKNISFYKYLKKINPPQLAVGRD